jgi:glucose/mannose-6-phosphate isomerase
MADYSKKLQALRGDFDKNGMLDLVMAFPTHMTDAWERGKSFAGQLKTETPKKIILFGMGGSAIGGDMVRSYLGDRLRVPLHVNRAYDVPASFREEALFVFSSYSGNTGETLAAYDAVRGAGVPAVAITSGGELEKLCGRDSIPVCKIPGGMPPRSAIAYSFFPLLCTLDATGIARVDDVEFEEARTALEQLCASYGPDSPDNEAADLAHTLHGKLPFVYSCGGIFEAVSRRWSCQINENGKSLAHFATFSELNHNEIVGWKALESMRRDIVVISLEDEEDHPMALKQADIALEIIGPLSSGIIRIPNVVGGRMTRILSAMILGDFTSVYLAYLNGVDPTPVTNIDFLKDRLKK